MDELISEKQCKRMLCSISPDYILESYEVKPLEEESMGGLIGQHYTICIEYKKNSTKEKLQFFMKTINKTSMVMYKISSSLRMFEKESLFLMTLLPLFEEIGIDISFAPRAYLCENEAAVMEDLSLSNFKLFPKTQPLDLEHCFSCLKVIAKLHSSSILYEISKSESLGMKFSLNDEYPDLLKNLVLEGNDNNSTLNMESALNGLLAVAKLEFDKNEDFHKFEDKVYTLISNEDENRKYGKCLLHGDVWSNNFLHRYDDNKLVETKLIDFQLLNYGPPSLDVLHFIYLNTRKTFRDEHFKSLLNYYYSKLKELLYDKNVFVENILPRDEYFQICEHFKLPAKLYCTLDRCMTCLSDEHYFDVINKDGNLEQFVLGDRGQFLIGPYQTVSQYQDIIGEDLRELWDMLFKSSDLK